MAFLDETGLAELWELIQAEDAKLAAADVKIATGSYTGTGTYGKSNPKSLTFEFVPKIVFVTHGTSSGSAPTVLIALHGDVRGARLVGMENASDGYVELSWSGNTVSWYFTSTAHAQLNDSSFVYRYIAIG